jgi:hypothetical protein
MPPSLTREELAAITPRQVQAAGLSLSVFCPSCRVLRDVGRDFPALMAVRPDQPLREMRFRCATCGNPGTPFLSWRDQFNTPTSFDFATMTLRHSPL